MTMITRDDRTKVLWMGYNVARNPIGTLTNAPIASTPSKELHPPILSTLEIQGGQVKIYIYIYTVRMIVVNMNPL